MQGWQRLRRREPQRIALARAQRCRVRLVSRGLVDDIAGGDILSSTYLAYITAADSRDYTAFLLNGSNQILV